MPIKPENRSRYPKDWPLRSYFVIHVRGKDRCEWCGAKNYEPHPTTGSIVILTCAHVFDKRPEACCLLNLAGLCQRCHNRHDAEDRASGKKERKRGPCEYPPDVRVHLNSHNQHLHILYVTKKKRR